MDPQQSSQDLIPLQPINNSREDETSVDSGVQTEWGSLDEQETEVNWGTEGQGEVDDPGGGGSEQTQPEVASESDAPGSAETSSVENGGGKVNGGSGDDWLVVGVKPVPGAVSVLISGVAPGGTNPLPKVVDYRIRDCYSNDFYNQYCFFAQFRAFWNWQPKRNNLLIQFLKNLKLPGFKDGAKDGIHISRR